MQEKGDKPIPSEKQSQAKPVFEIGRIMRKPVRRRQMWEKAHDRVLAALVEKYKCGNWKTIARQLNHEIPGIKRSAKTCRERWKNCANPAINKKRLSPEEELLLLLFHNMHHYKWKEIAAEIPGRISSLLQNHFYSTFRKTAREILNRTIQDSAGTFLGFITYLYMIQIASAIIHDNGSPSHMVRFIKNIGLKQEDILEFLKLLTDKFLAVRGEELGPRIRKMINSFQGCKDFFQEVAIEIMKEIRPFRVGAENLLANAVSIVSRKAKEDVLIQNHHIRSAGSEPILQSFEEQKQGVSSIIREDLISHPALLFQIDRARRQESLDRVLEASYDHIQSSISAPSTTSSLAQSSQFFYSQRPFFLPGQPCLVLPPPLLHRQPQLRFISGNSSGGFIYSTAVGQAFPNIRPLPLQSDSRGFPRQFPDRTARRPP